MDWKDVGKKIASVGLPLLGTALGGPAGGAAGALIAAALGKTPSDLTQEDVLSATADPAILVKLKEIEANHEIELQRLIVGGGSAFIWLTGLTLGLGK